MTIKVVVIGSGKLGQRHLSKWINIENVEIVGVIARNQTKLKEVVKKYQTKAFGSISEAVRKTDVDIFDICTPTYTHIDLIKEVAQWKKHIICEKPLALNTSEAKEAISICEENGVQLFVAHTLRFFPIYIQARQYLLNNKIGKPGIIRIERGVPHPPKSWYSDEEKSGGLFLDLGIHDLDWLLWSCGEANAVMANEIRSCANKIKYGVATIRMGNGAIAYIKLSWSEQKFYSLFEITGNKGTLVYDSRNDDSVVFKPYADIGEEFDEMDTISTPHHNKDPYHYQLEHFVKCILGKEVPIITAREAMKAVELGEAIIRSAKKGKHVDLNVLNY